MQPELEIKDLSPEQWQFLYNSLASSITMDDNQRTQYAASTFMVEPVFEFPTEGPALASMRRFYDPSSKEVIEMTLKELLIRAKREGYTVAGTVDIVQWRSHALALSKINHYGEGTGVCVVLWHLPAAEGPVTFWFKAVNHTHWLKLHLRIALKPKLN